MMKDRGIQEGIDDHYYEHRLLKLGIENSEVRIASLIEIRDVDDKVVVIKLVKATLEIRFMETYNIKILHFFLTKLSKEMDSLLVILFKVELTS